MLVTALDRVLFASVKGLAMRGLFFRFVHARPAAVLRAWHPCGGGAQNLSMFGPQGMAGLDLMLGESLG